MPSHKQTLSCQTIDSWEGRTPKVRKEREEDHESSDPVLIDQLSPKILTVFFLHYYMSWVSYILYCNTQLGLIPSILPYLGPPTLYTAIPWASYLLYCHTLGLLHSVLPYTGCPTFYTTISWVSYLIYCHTPGLLPSIGRQSLETSWAAL